MYPLFYREYSYSIHISVDDFLQKMDDDLLLTSSNSYRHEKQDRLDKFLPLKGEINKNKNKIIDIGLNAPSRGQTTANINLEYWENGDKLNVKFSFRESFGLFLISISALFLLIIVILSLKGILIFLLIFFPLILLRDFYPYFSNIKTIIRTFENYLSKNKIEFERTSLIKYSIINYLFKKGTNLKNF